MNKILVVARWEFMEKVKSKLFLIGLFVTPVIILAVSFLPAVFVTQEDKSSKVVGIIDESGQVAPEFARKLESEYHLSNGQPNYIVRIISEGSLDSSVAAATQLVVRDEIEGFCVVTKNPAGDTLAAEYRSKSVGDVVLSSRAEQTLREVVTQVRASQLGLTAGAVKTLLSKFDFSISKLSKEGEKEEGDFMKIFFKVLIFMMMMFFLIATSGQILVRSVIEEKSNRIVEILVSSCSPTELMSGKVLGLSALGLTQLAFWALIGLSVAFQSGHSVILPSEGLLLVLYFILGYLFYAAIFIGAGSPLNTEQEAQQINTYLILLLVLPVMLATPAMKDPGALWLRVLCYIPFFTPTVMALRISIQMPSAWEILATSLLMVAAVWVAMVVAGRIFRIGILSTGKTPRLKDIVQWVRTG
jgi:ABC-2 type transport system permease protein